MLSSGNRAADWTRPNCEGTIATNISQMFHHLLLHVAVSEHVLFLLKISLGTWCQLTAAFKRTVGECAKANCKLSA